MLAERLLQRVQRAAGGEALDRRRPRAPSAWTAKTRHERIGCPSSEHGARAADAVLAAEVRAGEAEVLAQDVGERAARLDGDLVASSRSR